MPPRATAVYDLCVTSCGRRCRYEHDKIDGDPSRSATPVWLGAA